MKIGRKKTDYTGRRSGMLEAIKYSRTADKGNRKETLWLFKCDCGKEKEICPHYVFNRKKSSIRSCGCSTKKFMSKIKIEEPGVAARNGLYATYRRSCAGYRDIPFELTKEQFFTLTQQNCYYCNKPPSQIKKSKVSFYVYNGVDRVDNTKGYTIDNVVSSCGPCNSLKSGVTLEMAKKIIEFIEKKKNV